MFSSDCCPYIFFYNGFYLRQPAVQLKKDRTSATICFRSVQSYFLYARNSHKEEIHCPPTVRRSILWFAGTYGIFSAFAEESSCSVYPPPVYFCQFILHDISYRNWSILIAYFSADFMPFFLLRTEVCYFYVIPFPKRYVYGRAFPGETLPYDNKNIRNIIHQIFEWQTRLLHSANTE